MDENEVVESEVEPHRGPCHLMARLFSSKEVYLLLAMQIAGIAGGFGLGVYVQGPATGYLFGTRAALVTNINCIATPMIALLFAVPFARWADGCSDPRKGLCWVVIGAQSPTFAMFLNGFKYPEKNCIWGFVIWCGVVGPMRCQMSGNPVLWAAYSDKVPPDVRVFGFQMLGLLPGLAVIPVCLIANQILAAFPYDAAFPDVFSYVQIFQICFLVGFLLTFLAIAFMSNTRSSWTLAAMEQQRDFAVEQEEISPFNYFAVLGNAYTFFRANTILLAVAGALSVYTLPDLAASYPATQIYYTIQDISVPDAAIYGTEYYYANGTAVQYGSYNMAYYDRVTFNTDTATYMATCMTVWPTIISMLINIAIAILANKFGPARAMVFWIPVTCVIFMSPFLLYYPWAINNKLVYIFIAVGVGSAGSIFPSLQALVTLSVPIERCAEALGCVAMCKDFMSLMAPLLMMAVMYGMDAGADGDPHALAKSYRWIFPGCGCIMFLAWPFVVYLSIHTTPKLPETDDAVFASVAFANAGPDYAASVGAVMSKKAAASRNLSSSVAQSVHESMAGSRMAASRMAESQISLRDSEVKT